MPGTIIADFIDAKAWLRCCLRLKFTWIYHILDKSDKIRNGKQAEYKIVTHIFFFISEKYPENFHFSKEKKRKQQQQKKKKNSWVSISFLQFT